MTGAGPKGDGECLDIVDRKGNITEERRMGIIFFRLMRGTVIP
jgi:hypothetical protein